MKSSFLDYVLEEVLRDVPSVTSRAMFGGFSLYKNGKIFGMIANDILYFKAPVSNRPFTYHKNGKTYAMKYWEVPEEIMSNPDEVAIWVNKSLSI